MNKLWRLLINVEHRTKSVELNTLCYTLYAFIIAFVATFNYGGCGSTGANSSSGSSTTPAQSAPSLTTNTATNITQVSATLNGTVNPNGAGIFVYFQYGTTIGYGNTTNYQDIGSGTTNVNVSANLTGLSINTIYNFRIVAINGSSTVNGTNQIFTTTGLPPACATNSATNINSNSARLNGAVNPNGFDTNAYFQWGPTTSYGNTTTAQAIGNGTSNVSVNAAISGLSLIAEYNFRVVGSSNSGTTYGNNLIFTTGNSTGSAPTCITDAADNITTISVRLNGTIIPNGVATTAYFNYGLTTSYTVTTSSQSIGSGITSVAITAIAGSLTPDTLYNFRVVGVNTTGTTYGNNLTFNTVSIVTSSLFIQQPTNTTAGAAITPPVTVRVTDQYNNPVPGVSVSLTTTTRLNGTATQVSNTGGIATFNNLSITTTGIYQLTARVPTDSVGINSNSFTITPDIANSLVLVFVQQPTTTTAGAAITPAVTVSIKDVYANPVSGISISITTTNGTVVNGTLTQNSNLNGIATFNNLSISVVGNSYALRATAGAINTTSSTFNIVSNNANLSSLTISQGTLNPSFTPTTINYTVDVPLTQSSIIVTPTATETTATITVNATPVTSGQASNPISLNLGPNQISIVVTAPDVVTTKTYTITVNRLYQQAYIKASNTEASDCFGYSVAMSGDTLVVGAVGILSDVLNGEDSNATGINGNQTDNSAADSGAVYVFTRSGNTWSQQAYIKASNTEANDYFGFSVAISGDTIVVGAYGEDSNTTGINGSQTNNSAVDSGAIYVFTRSGTTWSQQAYIKPSNTGASDYFGYSVAISGDTLAVGAIYEDSGTTGINSTPNESAAYSGAAYVFQRSGATWTQQAYIKPSNTGANDLFGISVAISDDTLVVGALYEDSSTTGINSAPNESTTDSGAAYVFVRSGVWTQQAYIKASNTGAGDLFGYSVAISGDTLVVGAYQEDSNTAGIDSAPNESATDSGAAYVFQRSGTTWSQQAYIKASNTGAGDWFGVNVAISGDTLLVGAVYEASNATGINGNQANNSVSESGAVYLFTRSGTTWSQQAYIKASNTGAGDNFGYSIAISGDTFVVSGYGESSSATGINGNQTDNNAVESGAVYVFR